MGIRQTSVAFAGKRGKLVIIGVAVVALVLVAIGAWWFSRRGPRGPWQEYTSEALGFTVSRPPNWSVTEEAAESGRDIFIAEQDGLAFVRVRGFFDPYLRSPEAIRSSIAAYEQALTRQEGAVVHDFRAEEVQGGIGGFRASGEFPVEGTTYRFEERGRMSTRGRVLILRAADVPEAFDRSIPTAREITESFRLH